MPEGSGNRMTFKENVVVRLVGLYIFLFPKSGMQLFAEITVRTNEKVAAMKREAKERSLAA